jgi:hypothetical protein
VEWSRAEWSGKHASTISSCLLVLAWTCTCGAVPRRSRAGDLRRRGRREKSGCIGLVGDGARARDVRGWDEVCYVHGVAWREMGTWMDVMWFGMGWAFGGLFHVFTFVGAGG